MATFVRVAQGGGFTAAAKGLGVPKSTVSRAVARLEGASACASSTARRAPSPSPTPDAPTTSACAALSRVLADASADVVDMGTEPRGTIRITAPVDLGQTLLAEVIARFVEKYPRGALRGVAHGRASWTWWRRGSTWPSVPRR